MARCRLYLSDPSMPCWMLNVITFTTPSLSLARGRIAATAIAASIRANAAPARMLIPARFLLVADLLPVLPRVGAERVRERRRPIDAAVGDVVCELAFLGIEVGEMANPLRDLVIGARGIAADAEAADARLAAIERD